MSYVIQNFSRITSINRLSYRRYFTWFYRNTALIWLLLNYLNSSSQIYTQGLYPPYLLHSFFSKSLFKLFTKNVIRWRPVRESQWVRGLEYWTYYLFLSVMSSTSRNLALQKLSTPYLFFNQPLLEKKYVMISFYQKYYRYTLVTFLHLLLRHWQYWRYQLFYSLELLITTRDFFLLRFLNTRLFKVYLV